MDESYVVVFSEYGGSRGYGKPHYEDQQYGAGDVADVLSVTQWFAKEPQFGGLPFDNLQAYIDSSPIMHVEKIETPLLIHATTYDGTVNHKLHSERLVEALKAHGKKYEYKLYERAPGGHDFSDGDSAEAIDSLNRIVGFLEKHLK